MPPITILLVDDLETWRRFVGFILRVDLGIRIVQETADASEAVKAAGVQRPDVVLLDIGLPDTCGIAAAREILKHAPETKIVFVTQESEIDVVHEALSTGAFGYVLKVDAASELVRAVHSAFRGERYLSRSLPRTLGTTH